MKKIEQFKRALYAMRWDNRRLLELEGLKQWMRPREKGYVSLQAALGRQGELCSHRVLLASVPMPPMKYDREDEVLSSW